MNNPDTCLEIVADIGGTNARFGCVANHGSQLFAVQHLLCADFPHILDAILAYLAELDPAQNIARICLAVAGPVETDYIKLPNNHWAFSRQQLQQALGFELVVINDFTAQLLNIFTLNEHELVWLGSARPGQNLVIAALGPGTGLGVAGMTANGDIIPSEGGHLAFAPLTEHEVQLLQQLWQHFPRVSVERILSGPGLSALYQANAAIQGQTVLGDFHAISAAELTRLARTGDPLCLQAIADFAAILGSVAGEIALALGARGGIYLAGGILPHIEGLYPQQLLRERFNAKGRFTQYCTDIPLALVKAENTGLRGCIHALRKGYR